jgi:hypothetical protein
MKLLRYSISTSLLVYIVTGCATVEQKTSLRRLPAVTVEGEKAWNILLDTIKNYYPGIEYANKDTGEVRSIGIVIDTCWAGLANGGFVPCKLERLIAHVSSFNPFNAEIAIQQHKGTVLSNYKDFNEDGNNTEKEKEIYEVLVKNLTIQEN